MNIIFLIFTNIRVGIIIIILFLVSICVLKKLSCLTKITNQSDMNLNSLSLELVYLTLCFAVSHYGKLKKKKWEEA